jgi:hypothetical protein
MNCGHISNTARAVNEGMEIANYVLTTPPLCYKRSNHFQKRQVFLNDAGQHEKRAIECDRITGPFATRSSVPYTESLAHRF